MAAVTVYLPMAGARSLNGGCKWCNSRIELQLWTVQATVV